MSETATVYEDQAGKLTRDDQGYRIEVFGPYTNALMPYPDTPAAWLCAALERTVGACSDAAEVRERLARLRSKPGALIEDLEQELFAESDAVRAALRRITEERDAVLLELNQLRAACAPSPALEALREKLETLERYAWRRDEDADGYMREGLDQHFDGPWLKYDDVAALLRPGAGGDKEEGK